MDDNCILDAKYEFDRSLRLIPRADHSWRLKLWRDWLRLWDAPLRSVRHPIIPASARGYDPMLDSARRWRGER